MAYNQGTTTQTLALLITGVVIGTAAALGLASAGVIPVLETESTRQLKDAIDELHNTVTDEFERNDYFHGKLLTTEDFEEEQRYLRDSMSEAAFEASKHYAAVEQQMGEVLEDLDRNNDKTENIEASLGQGLLGETEGVELECPPDLEAPPCDGFTAINTLGRQLSHPKKVSLWVSLGFDLEPGDVFVVRAHLLLPNMNDTETRCDVPTTGKFPLYTIKATFDADDAATPDGENSGFFLPFDQLPVPCGVTFTVERMGYGGEDADFLVLAIVLEEV